MLLAWPQNADPATLSNGELNVWHLKFRCYHDHVKVALALSQENSNCRLLKLGHNSILVLHFPVNFASVKWKFIKDTCEK